MLECAAVGLRRIYHIFILCPGDRDAHKGGKLSRRSGLCAFKLGSGHSTVFAGEAAAGLR